MTSDQPSYVLGSGPSIMDLSEDERLRLSAQPFVFAMNKYLLFWEKVGIAPTHYFLIDTHFPAYAVLQRTIERSKELPRPVQYCLGYRFRPFVNQPFLGKICHYRALKRVTQNDRGFQGHFLSVENPLFFKHVIDLFAPFSWADSLHEPLYYFRGSLTILLNLITILNPGNPIYLIGVDMNTHRSFYDEELAADQMLRDDFHAIGEKTGKHPTVVEKEAGGGNVVPGLLDKWDLIREACEKRGCVIRNINPKSMLVQEGKCEYAQLPSI